MSEEKENLQENVISEGDVIENVHISPIGVFNGSDGEGNPVPETIDRESLEALAEKLNAGDEVLFDADHQSTRAGEGRSTRAAGWFSKFFVDPVKGLFGKLKLTKWGKELISGREYRYVSPTFGLDENGKPVELYSIAATNTPAFAGAISPILNQAPAGEGNLDISTLEQELSDMELNKLKAELIEEILETIHKEFPLMNACATEKAKADDTASKAVNEGTEMPVDEQAKPEAPEEVKEGAGATETATEVKEQAAEEKVEKPDEEKPAEEKPAEEKKADEVIKIETLNSSPAKPTLAPQPEAWRSMSQKDFIQWIESGAYRK